MQFQPKSITYRFNFYIDIGKRERTIFYAFDKYGTHFLGFVLEKLECEAVDSAEDETGGFDVKGQVCIEVMFKNGTLISQPLVKQTIRQIIEHLKGYVADFKAGKYPLFIEERN